MRGSLMNNEFYLSDGVRALVAVYIKEQTEEALIKALNQFGKEAHLSSKELKHIAIDEFRAELDKLASKDFVKAEIAELRTELKQDIANVESELKASIANVDAGFRQGDSSLRVEIAETKNQLIKWIIWVGVSATIVSISANFALFSFLVSSLK